MLTKELSLLAKHQEEMVEKNELRTYKGLCMQEAALLRSSAKEAKDKGTQSMLLCAANNAIKRALQIDLGLDTNA